MSFSACGLPCCFRPPFGFLDVVQWHRRLLQDCRGICRDPPPAPTSSPTCDCWPVCRPPADPLALQLAPCNMWHPMKAAVARWGQHVPAHACAAAAATRVGIAHHCPLLRYMLLCISGWCGQRGSCHTAIWHPPGGGKALVRARRWADCACIPPDRPPRRSRWAGARALSVHLPPPFPA